MVTVLATDTDAGHALCFKGSHNAAGHAIIFGDHCINLVAG